MAVVSAAGSIAEQMGTVAAKGLLSKGKSIFKLFVEMCIGGDSKAGRKFCRINQPASGIFEETNKNAAGRLLNICCLLEIMAEPKFQPAGTS